MRVAAYTACIALLVLLAPGACLGASVLSDDFDDGVLDEAWAVTYDRNAVGWDYTESDSLLDVSNILTGSVGTAKADSSWAIVALTQSFDPITDFDLIWTFGWNCEGSIEAMQKVRLRLYSGDDLVTNCSYNDPWIAHTGQQDVRIGATEDVFYQSGPDSGPDSGMSTLAIVRSDDVMTISWDGVDLLTGASTAPVDRVEISFWYWAVNLGYRPPSFFGSEAVNLIAIEAPEPVGEDNLVLNASNFGGDPGGLNTVPEPATALVLAAGGLLLTKPRRRK